MITRPMGYNGRSPSVATVSVRTYRRQDGQSSGWSANLEARCSFAVKRIGAPVSRTSAFRAKHKATTLGCHQSKPLEVQVILVSRFLQ
jgi:hypothetical protein